MKLLFSLLLFLSSLSLHAKDYTPTPYTWTTQSKNSSESMPCGGHDVGMNVWVENNDVLFYICRSGWFDESNTLLKAGRFRIHFNNLDGINPNDVQFNQTLSLDEGCINITLNNVKVCIWADVNSPVVYANIKQGKRGDVIFSYESWRYKDRPVTRDECQQNSWKWNIQKDCKVFADSIMPYQSSLTFYHQNRAETVFDFTVNKEGLDSVKSLIPNPIGNLCFGGTILAKGFTYQGTTDGIYCNTDYRAWNYKSKALSKGTITIALSLPAGSSFPLNQRLATEGKANSSQCNSSEIASPSLMFSSKMSGLPSATASRAQSKAWWHAYWQRSWITTTEPRAKTMVRNYELFRYMLGCNAYGQWPTKFNGGLFTFDPVFVDDPRTFTPDYRCWGGGTMTAQNQRLVYWPMLKSGDWDMMPAQFDTYLRMLPAATLRTKCYWHHDGASFCEQIENFGLPNPAEYGKHKLGEDPGNERNAWLEYLWDTSLEFCQMILLAHNYGGMDITKYEPLIEQCLIFFDHHYRYLAKQRGTKPLTEDGKLILYPSSACETYKMAYNPASVISALKVVSMGYHNYKLEQADKSTIEIQPSINENGKSMFDSTWLKLHASIPEIPIKDNRIQPAALWERIQNVETPQLYPVFPWRIYGVGRPNLDIARNTYLNDPWAQKMNSSKGWKQDNIWAADLGLTDEAVRLNTEKLADGPFRFPAFWEIGFDWAPDHNKGGASMIGLQDMLLQETPDGEILLLPAWPKDWDVHFKLRATNGRTIEF